MCACVKIVIRRSSNHTTRKRPDNRRDEDTTFHVLPSQKPSVKFGWKERFSLKIGWVILGSTFHNNLLFRASTFSVVALVTSLKTGSAISLFKRDPILEKEIELFHMISTKSGGGTTWVATQRVSKQCSPRCDYTISSLIRITLPWPIRSSFPSVHGKTRHIFVK